MLHNLSKHLRKSFAQRITNREALNKALDE